MEKLVKSVNALKFFYGGLSSEDKTQKDALQSPNERQSHCNIVLESIISPSIRSLADYPGLLAVSVETLLQSCADDNADVRLNANECLNRLIKGLYEISNSKILVELYKEIKKNGHPRSLRAALDRFSRLSHNIRSNKCRPYILNLLPCLCRISQREEDGVQETLGLSLVKIFKILGPFASESEIQGLLASFLKNLSHKSATMRRTACVCLHSVILNCRKQNLVIGPLMNSILDILLQRNTDRNTVLGCLQALRILSPLFETCVPGKISEQHILNEHRDLVLKVFDACVFYLDNTDHTIVTAALELLEHLLNEFSSELASVLIVCGKLKPTSFTPSTVLPDEVETKATSVTTDEVSSLSSLASSTIEDKLSCIRLLPVEDQDPPSNPLLPHNEQTSQTNGATEHKDQTEPSDLDQTITNHDEDAKLPENGHEESLSESSLEKMASDPISTSSDLIPVSHLYATESSTLPIITLARMLCQRFLLSMETGEVLPDKQVRVSNKNLTMNTLSQLVKIYPAAVCHSLLYYESSSQYMTNVFLYSTHSDPKLRGSAVTLASVFIDAVVTRNRKGIKDWFKNVERNSSTSLKCPTIEDLISLIHGGLIDESSTTTRQACSAVTSCVHTLLNSMYFSYGLELLHMVVGLQSSTYWLIKVSLLELLASLNYRQIAYLELLSKRDAASVKTQSLPHQALSIALKCLCDDDLRLRKTAAATIVTMPTSFPTPNELYGDLLTSEAAEMTRQWMGGSEMRNEDEEEQSNDAGSAKSLLKTYRGYEMDCKNSGSITDSLSYIVGEVSTMLTNSSNKHQTYGCLLALKQLSIKYMVSNHPVAWGCYAVTDDRSRSSSNESETSSNSSDSKIPKRQSSNPNGSQQQFGILPFVMSLLHSAWLPLDVTAHSDALVLAGNLVAGAASDGLKVFGPVAIEDQSFEKVSVKTVTSNARSWATIYDPVLGSYANQLFTHLTRLSSIMHHVISEVTPSPPNKSVLPNIAPGNIPSPIKRKEKAPGEQNRSSPPLTRKLLPTSSLGKPGNKENQDEKPTKKLIGSFYNNRTLMRLFDQLTGSYKNYKVSLEFGCDDRFCSFLSSTLDVLSQVLELAVFQDIGSYTEELLNYMKSLFTVEPTLTIQSVQQLLKALFGTNLVSNMIPHDDSKPPNPPTSPILLNSTAGFYHQIFHHPLNHLTMAIANSSFHHSLQTKSPPKENDGWFGSIKKKVEKKLNDVSKNSKGSKSSIQNYIRLFEILVIKSLKLYTTTSSVEFQQKHVLNLLAQLVQLRVNYCMLDSDQVFINFIIKQFESIEGGLVRGSESLIPHVFFFLVLLSYERYRTKAVITMPKIIQLCDGLMASGQGSASHVIPAMQPIIHDIYVVRASSKNEPPEVTTQREVVQFTLLKLLQHPQVFKMLITILVHGRRENVEKWKKYSRQVADVLLPLLSQLKVNVTSHDDVSTLHSLFEAISPSALRPIGLLMDLLLKMPKSLNSISHIHRWLTNILVLLRVLICQASEHDILDNIDLSKVKIKHMTCTHMEYLHSDQTSQEEEEQNMNEVFSPADILAMFFHQVIGSCCSTLLHYSTNPRTKSDESSQILLSQQINELFLALTYIHRSGSFKNLTSACKKVSSTNLNGFYTSDQMVSTFLHLTYSHPIITVMWAQYLSHFVPVTAQFWENFTGCKDTNDFPLNRNIVKKGCVILLADYVCQNSNQSELSLWLAEHHVNDIIMMSEEPPVQDFLTSVHLGAEESACLIKAISKLSKTQQNIKVSFILRILKCLSGVSIKSSESLISLLLSPKFLFSPVRRVFAASLLFLQSTVENILELNKEEALEIIPTEFTQNLMQKGESLKEKSQYILFCDLISQLHSHVTGEQPITSEKPGPTIQALMEKPNQNWFNSVILSCLDENRWTPECARVLACADFDDIIDIQGNNNFTAQHLASCLYNGIHEVTSMHGALIPYPEDKTSNLLAASLLTLDKKIKAVLEITPGNTEFDTPLMDNSNTEIKFIGDKNFQQNLMWLNRCLVNMLKFHHILPTQYQLPNVNSNDYLNIIVLGFKVTQYGIHKGKIPSLQDIVCVLESLQQALAVQSLHAMFINEVKWMLQTVQVLFTIMEIYIGRISYEPPYLPSCIDKEEASSIYNNSSNPLSSCIKLYQMLSLFRRQHKNKEMFAKIPTYIVRPINNIILHLATSPLFKNYVRTPLVVWTFGWNPALGGDTGTSLPEIPSDFLQEKEVLQEYIAIVNQIGWTKRTEFEETWASLLGVLVSQPVVSDESSGEAMHTEISSLAIRGLTSLVVDCALYPECGRKATSKYQVFYRHPTFKLGNTKAGRQLLKVRGILDDESRFMTQRKSHQDTHHQNTSLNDSSNLSSSLQSNKWITMNTERVLSSSAYGLAQSSVRSFHLLHGITPMKEELYDGDYDSATMHSFEYDNSLSNDGSDVSDMFETSEAETPDVPTNPAPPLSPLRIRDGVDVHSCVQFLLELYTEWFRTTAQTNQISGSSSTIARPLLCECVRSLLLISDLFTEKQQFEWMFVALTTLHNAQPADDDILMQYITPSMCKAGSVLGLNSETSENVLRVLEPSLRSTLLSCRTSALVGLLQCIESYPNPNLRGIIDLASQFIPPNFVAISTCPSLFNEDYVVLLASVAFYIIEKCHDAVMPEFTSVIIQACTLIISSRDVTSVQSRVFHSVTHGLQRLILSFSISASECDSILKVAAEQVHTNPWLPRATAACGLMMTCMYCGRMRISSNPDHGSPHGGSPEHEDVVESRLLAMERVTLLFERIRKGYPHEARVMSKVLPSMLDDFFPAQDIMNKIIAEFISTLQPFPASVAQILYEVFQSLLERDQSHLVQEWVMLSLGNAIQRTPLQTAVWCLTCLFSSASTNRWISSMVPLIISRVHDPTLDVNWTFFCKAAVDFYTCQLSEELDRRSFHAIFSTSSSSREPGSPYKLLLDCISRINGEQGILQ
uniref:huntingtin n=1 Tax=Ciona intestinalis TaxID=7719 RepID=UPI000BB141EB|nr:huntingtin [Ciona intestinalis]|eukprot:NP_001342356.1 huntingtin [Ciona intestinalis]